jgi:hypothetical protein
MSFWKSKTGGVIDGSVEHSHAVFFPIIPDGTTATASIKQVELKNFNGESFYQVTYKLIDGDFKGREVRQKIKCFNPDDKKRDRAVNMLMRLFNICGLTPTHLEAPKPDDFIPMAGKIVGIKIQEWADDGKEGNYVSEIYAPDTKFVVATGVKMVHTPQHNADLFNSALSANNAPAIDTDVPW